MAEPKAPAVDLKDILVAGSHGTFALATSSTAWGIQIGGLVDLPNKQINLNDEGGQFDNPRWLLEEPVVQILVRADQYQYEESYSKMFQIKDELLGIGRSTQNNTVYTGIIVTSPPFFVTWDEQARPIWSMRVKAWREPSSTGTGRLAF